MPYILALDEGTTSARAHRLRSGRHRPSGRAEGISRSFSARRLGRARSRRDLGVPVGRRPGSSGQAGLEADGIAAIGITNQRETTVVWDRATGQPVYPRHRLAGSPHGAAAATSCAAAGREALVRDTHRAGASTPISPAARSPGFSTTCRAPANRPRRGELAFGTIDTWLIWKLTGGAMHVTDATNASRTMLFNIHTGQWDDELLAAACDVPREVLAGGALVERSLRRNRRRISAVPHRRSPASPATSRRRCSARCASSPGMAKNTYGTGCFMLLNIGPKPVASTNIGCSRPSPGKIGGQTDYALEGSVFIAGAVVQWLRDGLG